MKKSAGKERYEIMYGKEMEKRRWKVERVIESKMKE